MKFSNFAVIYCPFGRCLEINPPLDWITEWGIPKLANQFPFIAYSSFGAKFIYFSINHTCMWIYVMSDCKDKLFQEYFSGFKHYGTNIHVRLVSLSRYSELPTLEQPSLCLYILFPNSMRNKFLNKKKIRQSLKRT